ncbi:nicotinate (nicotinamide) nucleotide adenylyltransferase [Hydrogenophaga sp.]|uniref:nicotinate (nicotinamide) nucleotide adenylyltransferase n=1 Tax=Hydrogenophaga sp. TaxID=1904254 RepID=UPI0035B17C8E
MPGVPPGSAADVRIGVFGGAFDPPHRAHRQLAEVAIRELRLDRLHIVPTGQAWHKPRVLSQADDRLAMCRLAFGDLPSAHVDEREVRRASASYTVDTLEELRREFPGAQLLLVIGEDQLQSFRRWHRWQDILSLATLVVAARPAADGHSGLASGAERSAPDLPFQRLALPLLSVSSSAVRALAAGGRVPREALSQLVPDPVASYISTHSLYQQPS